MRVHVSGVTFAACFWLATIAAQAQPAAPVVQLPTFSVTGVSTTVMVPDNGAAFLGSINRSSIGRSEAGVPGITFPGFQNRGIGQDKSASNFWVTAKIHDFDAMDQALLNTPSPDGVARTYASPSSVLGGNLAAIAGRALPGRAANLAGDWRVEPAPAPAGADPAAEHANRMARQSVRANEAEDFFSRGQQAEEAGKPNVAKIYYQMAFRRATGDLKQQAQTRLYAVTGRTASLAKMSP